MAPYVEYLAGKLVLADEGAEEVKDLIEALATPVGSVGGESSTEPPFAVLITFEERFAPPLIDRLRPALDELLEKLVQYAVQRGAGGSAFTLLQIVGDLLGADPEDEAAKRVAAALATPDDRIRDDPGARVEDLLAELAAEWQARLTDLQQPNPDEWRAFARKLIETTKAKPDDYQLSQLSGWLDDAKALYGDPAESGFRVSGRLSNEVASASYGAARLDLLGPDGSQLLTARLTPGWVRKLLEEEEPEIEAAATPELRSARQWVVPKANNGEVLTRGRFWFEDGRPFGVRSFAVFAPPAYGCEANDDCCSEDELFPLDEACCDPCQPQRVLRPARAIAMGETDADGYFTLSHSPDLVSSYAWVRIAGLRMALAIGLVDTPPKGGGKKSFPRPLLLAIDPAYLAESPALTDRWSLEEDEDCGCVGLGDLDRALEEFTYDIVIRTGDPQITRKRLALPEQKAAPPPPPPPQPPQQQPTAPPAEPASVDAWFRTPIDRDRPVRWDEEEPVIAQATTIAHGRILTFKQVWRQDGFSKGEPVGSIPLAPLQKKNVAILDWSRTESFFRTDEQTNEEYLTNVVTRDRDISEVVNSALRETSSGRSDSGSSARSSGGGGFLGAIFGGSSGGSSGAWSSSSSESTRSLAAGFLNKLRDHTLQAATSLRAQRVTTVQQVEQSESSRATTETLANRNACHAITILYFEVLRHFRIEQELADVRECLYIPLPITGFDEAKAVRWRDELMRYLPTSELRAGLDSCERLLGNASPDKALADRPVTTIGGQIHLGFDFPTPDTAHLDTLPAGAPADSAWLALRNAGYPAGTAWDAMLAAFRASPPAARDAYYQGNLVPELIRAVAEGVTVSLAHSGAPGTHAMTVTPGGAAGRTRRILNVDGAAALAAQPLTRRSIGSMLIHAPSQLPPNATVSIAAVELHYAVEDEAMQLLDLDHRVLGQQLPRTRGGLDLSFSLPLRTAELKVPLHEDDRRRDALLKHLQAHCEYYHGAIWWSMEPNRRFALLDGFVAPNSGGRSVASVVENKLAAIVGNCLVMPVAPGIRLDNFPEIARNADDGKDGKDGKTSDSAKARDRSGSEDRATLEELLNAYRPPVPAAPLLISIPTRGVFAESVMGACNSCEKIDDSRNWRYWEHPLLDQPPAINPLTVPVPQPAPEPSAPPQPAAPVIAQVQTVPYPAPDPSSLQAVLAALANPNIFRDPTGLAGTQQNAREALAQSFATTQKFGELGAQAMMKVFDAAISAAATAATGVPIMELAPKVKDAIGKDVEAGRISPDQGRAAISRVNDLLTDSLGGSAPTSPLDQPDVAAAIGKAAERGASLSVSRGDTRVDVGPSAAGRSSPAGQSGAASRLPWPLRLFQPSEAQASPPRTATREGVLFEKLWKSRLAFATHEARDVYRARDVDAIEREQGGRMNMCATRVSLALHDAGLGRVFAGRREYIHKQDGRGLFASVAGLSKLLKDRFGDPVNLVGVETAGYRNHPSIKDQKGIIAFHNYWFRGQERSPTGDHIDIWTGSTIGPPVENAPLQCEKIEFWPIQRLLD